MGANWTRDQKAIVDGVSVAAQAWSAVAGEQFPRTHQGVFLCGAVGAGKTAIAQALFPRSAWFNAPDVGREATSSMHHGHGGRSAHDMLRDAMAAQVTVIDELGRERESDHYGRDTVWSLINGCLNRRRFLVCISNKTPADVVKAYGGDEGLASRLALLKLFTFPATMQDFRRSVA